MTGGTDKGRDKLRRGGEGKEEGKMEEIELLESSTSSGGVSSSA